jgi:hypothetical protein
VAQGRDELRSHIRLGCAVEGWSVVLMVYDQHSARKALKSPQLGPGPHVAIKVPDEGFHQGCPPLP